MSNASSARQMRHSYATYLELDVHDAPKMEYHRGEIFAMAGGTPEHGALAAQFMRLITLKPTCRVFSSDVRIRIDVEDLTVYPDVSIVCGPLERAAIDPNAITNPRFIVEVTSPSTERYDRGVKREHYQRLASVHAIVLISHSEPAVTLIHREGEGWAESTARRGEALLLEEGVSLDVDALYSVVDFEAASAS